MTSDHAAPAPSFAECVQIYIEAERDELAVGLLVDSDPEFAAAHDAFQRAKERLAAVAAPYTERRKEAEARKNAARAAMLAAWPNPAVKTIPTETGHKFQRAVSTSVRVVDDKRAVAYFHDRGILLKAIERVSWDEKAIEGALNLWGPDDAHGRLFETEERATLRVFQPPKTTEAAP